MSTFYIKRGTTFTPTDQSSVIIEQTLPAGNYIVKQDPMTHVMFLEAVDNFVFTTKRYGKNPCHSARIINTFLSRPNATGVMLAGEKGSGKSLLAKTISIDAAQQGIPTIVINAPWRGDAFNSFIQSIEQPCIVLFDEFEKVYDRDEQEEILTLLDGVFPSKKLFILTCNDKWRVDSHMRNRPGRIFYMLDFTGLDAAFIEEYCNDNLNEKKWIPSIIKLAAYFTQFNFDMLKALVEEMNRYNEAPDFALQMLNVRPEYDESSPEYNMILTRNDKVLKLYNSKFRGNLLNHAEFELMYLEFIPPSTKGDDDDEIEHDENGDVVGPGRWETLQFNQDNLSVFTSDYAKFTKDDFVITFTRKAKAAFNWLDALI
jgi:hypothetical protein